MTRRWLCWVVTSLASTLTGCPGSDTPAGAGTEGETETETDTEGTGSNTSTTLTTSTPTTNDTMTASGTATSTSTTDPDTTATTSSGTDTNADATDGCPPGTEGCPCDVGSTCQDELQCIEGTCVAEQPCDNPEGEPNDTEAEAIELDDAVCNADPTMVAGALEGVEDDWFTYDGVPSMLGQCSFSGSPSVAVTSDLTLQVCIFVVCTGGDPGDVNSCPMGTQAEDSPDGQPGCCGDDMASLSTQGHGCGIANGDPIYTVRVSGGEDGACTAYDLAYDYSAF